MMNFAGCIPLGPAVKSYVWSLQLFVIYYNESEILSAHWTQMLPSSSSFHLQSIQQEFMAPLCSSELQEGEAVLTWEKQEEQQEQKCCQLPFRERHCQQARAVHGMVTVGIIPVSSTAPAVAERKGWSTVDARGAFPLPQAPLMDGQCCSSCSAKCCLGLHRALLRNIPENLQQRSVLENQPPEGMHLHLHSRSIAWKLIAKGFFGDLILPKILGVLSSPMSNGKRHFGESQDTPLLANRRPTGYIDLSLSPGRQFITKGSVWIKVDLFLSSFIHWASSSEVFLAVGRKKKQSSSDELTIPVDSVLVKYEEWLIERSTLPGYIGSTLSLLYFNQISHSCVGLFSKLISLVFIYPTFTFLRALETWTISISNFNVCNAAATAQR